MGRKTWRRSSYCVKDGEWQSNCWNKGTKEDIVDKIANLNLVSVGNDQIISIQELENFEKAIDEKKKQSTECENWLQRLNVYLKAETK